MTDEVRITVIEDFSWAQCEIVHLDAERLGALVTRIDVDLAIGDTDVIGELQGLVLERPHHEGFCARLMWNGLSSASADVSWAGLGRAGPVGPGLGCW